MATISPGPRPERWTRAEVLEQVASAPADAAALVDTAEAILRWADSKAPFLRVLGGRGHTDRSLIMYAGPGRGKGVVTLYGAENDGGPMLEIHIDYMATLSHRSDQDTRTRLVASLSTCGVPRLQASDVPTMVRPNVPLSQLADGHLQPLLSVLDGWLAELG